MPRDRSAAERLGSGFANEACRSDSEFGKGAKQRVEPSTEAQQTIRLRGKAIGPRKPGPD
jgi:hypothetical protein